MKGAIAFWASVAVAALSLGLLFLGWVSDWRFFNRNVTTEALCALTVHHGTLDGKREEALVGVAFLKYHSTYSDPINFLDTKRDLNAISLALKEASVGGESKFSWIYYRNDQGRLFKQFSDLIPAQYFVSKNGNASVAFIAIEKDNPRNVSVYICDFKGNEVEVRSAFSSIPFTVDGDPGLGEVDASGKARILSIKDTMAAGSAVWRYVPIAIKKERPVRAIAVLGETYFVFYNDVVGRGAQKYSIDSVVCKSDGSIVADLISPKSATRLLTIFPDGKDFVCLYESTYDSNVDLNRYIFRHTKNGREITESIPGSNLRNSALWSTETRGAEGERPVLSFSIFDLSKAKKIDEEVGVSWKIYNWILRDGHSLERNDIEVVREVSRDAK